MRVWGGDFHLRPAGLLPRGDIRVEGGEEKCYRFAAILYTVIFPLPFLSPTTLYSIWFLNKLCFQEFCDISGRDKIAYLAKLNVENVPVAKLQECKNFPFAGS